MIEQASNYFVALSKGQYRVIGIPAFDDNYFWLIDNGVDCAVVDPGDAAPVEQVIADLSLNLTTILLTHHHDDHVGGVAKLCHGRTVEVYGALSKSKLPMVNRVVAGGDSVKILGLSLQIFDIPGHTLEHIGYYCAVPNGLEIPMFFAGDTLFVAGCGRVFEGTHKQMQQSLSQFKSLPANTHIFCAHEYTLSNLRFAAAVEPDNEDIQAQITRCTQLRSDNLATVPTTLGVELLTNPFLRWDDRGVIATAEKLAQRSNLQPAEVFGEIRHWKDNF